MDSLIEAYLGVYNNLDEANRWERESGIGGKSPEAELARMRSRAFHTGGVGSRGSKNTVNPSDIEPGTLNMNRGVARMIHDRNRGKSPLDPTYSHRKKIDPLKIDSWRDTPLGRPRNDKDPLKQRANNKNPGNIGDKVNASIRPLQTKVPTNAKSNIRKFQREELEYILDILVSEGFAVDYDSAGCILEAMSDEWLGSLIDGVNV
jgi:hypothetical protein